MVQNHATEYRLWCQEKNNRISEKQGQLWRNLAPKKVFAKSSPQNIFNFDGLLVVGTKLGKITKKKF